VIRLRKNVALLLVLILLTAPTSVIAESTSSNEMKENFWTTKASLPEGVSVVKAAVVNGKIYAMTDSSNYEYDPAKDVWTAKTPMPTPRQSSTFSVVACQNKIYVIGGNNGSSGYENYLSINEVYDPATDSWETKKPMPSSREWAEATAVDGKIYVISGVTDNYRSFHTPVNEVYDPATDSWTTRQPIPYAVIKGASVVVDKKIYIMGGLFESTDPLNAIYNQIYDTETDTWSFGASLPTPMWYTAAGATTGVKAPKRIYVMGGGFTEVTNVVNIYDPAFDTWISGSPLPTNRTNHAIAVVNDVLYVMGGAYEWHGGPPLTPGSGWTLTNIVEQYTPFLFGTVPVVSITSPKNMTYGSKDVPLNFNVSEATSWMGYRLDDQATVTITGNTDLNGLAEGTHKLWVYAKNFAGDVTASTTVHFTIDVTSPSIVVFYPENKTYQTTDVLVKFIVNEPASQINYCLDGSENTTIAENFTLTQLSNGNHNVTIYATDEAGNTGASEIVYFTVAVPEPFPTTLVIASVIIVTVVGTGLLVYFMKRKH